MRRESHQHSLNSGMMNCSVHSSTWFGSVWFGLSFVFGFGEHDVCGPTNTRVCQSHPRPQTNFHTCYGPRSRRRGASRRPSPGT